MTLGLKRLEEIAESKRQAAQAQGTGENPTNWPTEYSNKDSGRIYQPHSDGEQNFVYQDSPKYFLAKGGEGAGKSVAGIVKTLNRIKRGCSGIMVSPDFEHFKKSLWQEFRRWCPWDLVVPSQRRRANKEWTPPGPFDMVFETPHGEAVLMCGGIEDPSGWEGPNVNFAHFDEARRHKEPSALKVLDGRVRISGPNGEPPQLYLTTTPRKHWLYEYFGPLVDNDPFESFKKNSFVTTLLTQDNANNLAAGYIEGRRSTLTAQEARVLLEAAWEDDNDVSRFLESMTWWDSCVETIPPLPNTEPIVVALDAAITSDIFGLIAVSRYPSPQRYRDIMVRHVMKWEPNGGKIDFRLVKDECWRIFNNFRPVCFTYDPYQLYDFATNMQNEGCGWWREFGQQKERTVGDKQLLDLIMSRRVVHDGNPDLREHLDNADKKMGEEENKLRIVKRNQGKKIDLAVCLSMASKVCLELEL